MEVEYNLQKLKNDTATVGQVSVGPRTATFEGVEEQTARATVLAGIT